VTIQVVNKILIVFLTIAAMVLVKNILTPATTIQKDGFVQDRNVKLVLIALITIAMEESVKTGTMTVTMITMAGIVIMLRVVQTSIVTLTIVTMVCAETM
jgi:hypothetical protein